MNDMSWYSNDGVLKYDIKKLRSLGKSPQYCNNVKYKEFDIIVSILLGDDELSMSQNVDIIATISNIVLLNRDLHLNHFVPVYSKKTFIYCDQFMKQIELSSPQNFQNAVPIFRILFLTLYGGLDDIDNDIIEDVFNILLKGFKDCMVIIEEEISNESYQLVLIEILKCLYTLNQKYHHGVSLVQDEEFTDSCLKIINLSFKNSKGGNFSLLMKNSFAFLLGLFTEREECNAKELFNGDMRIYKDFFHSVKVLLNDSLVRLNKSITPSEKEDTNTLVINYLVVLIHMSKSLINDVESEPKDHTSKDSTGSTSIASEDSTSTDPNKKHLQLLQNLSQIVIPNKESSDIYNELMKILASSAFSDLTEGFSSIQQSFQVKELIINLIYNSCYGEQKKFLQLVGFLNSESFLTKNGIIIDSSVDLENYQQPTSKYLDIKTYNEIRSYVSIPSNNTTPTTSIHDLTDEEKEREAEKLFNLFERMEKLGTFENFENPVKKWQREGRFENLD
ncbi:hypothetical protein CLIB1444_03S02366 [[Candida] jaroonii]|uniref:Uncharacterized protein n=1 Tax=[Candida] jaroonii TaxID=467808 RepID=A0ACA9Y4Z1_9ASCO|nr:hypothetical protein CLIB1444_03S02366 [[Candida] jaroonii]